MNCRLRALSTTWNVGPGAPPAWACHPVGMNSQEHRFSGEVATLAGPSPLPQHPDSCHECICFVHSLKSLGFPWLTPGEKEGDQNLVIFLQCLGHHFGDCPLFFQDREENTAAGSIRDLFFQRLFSCNVVLLYGNELWLTFSEDISLKTLRVLICSEEAFTLFEAQSQWEKRFSGAYCVQMQGACLSSLVPISKDLTFERLTEDEQLCVY